MPTPLSPVPINPAASDRELLVQLLLLVDAGFTDLRERISTMSAQVDALQSTVTDLRAAVAALKPLLDTSVDLGNRAIAKLEELSQQITAAQGDADAIARITADIGTTVADLRADQAEVTAGNASVQAELDKVTPPTTP